MQTLTRTYPDGTRASYTLQPGSAAADALSRPIKPYKLPRKGEKRTYPQFTHFMSTAEYVRAYYRANGIGQPDHFEPLNAAPSTFYQGLDSVETVEE